MGAVTLTYSIELAVGLACLAAAYGAARSLRRAWLTGLLSVAGLAAAGHALWGLAG